MKTSNANCLCVYEDIPKELCFLPYDNNALKLIQDTGIKGYLNYDSVNKYWYSTFFYDIKNIKDNDLKELRLCLLFEKRYDIVLDLDKLEIFNIINDHISFIKYIDDLLLKCPSLKYFDIPEYGPQVAENYWNHYINFYEWLKKLPENVFLDKNLR